MTALQKRQHITKIFDTHVTRLDSILASVSSQDPYMHSRGFVMMTGRLGLKIDERNDQTVIHAPHPNTPDEHIIFPVNLPQNLPLLLDTIKAQTNPVRLIRLPAGEASFLEKFLGDKLPDLDVRAIDEEVLDYVYPVYTVDCASFLPLKGKALYNFKKTLHKAEAQGLTHRAIDFNRDQGEIAEVIKLWSEQLPYFAPDMTTGAAKHLAGILSPDIPVKGIIVYDGDRPAAITLWEDALYGQTTSNALITLADRTIKGISEYLHYHMIAQTHADGHPHMCIGGAETASLDFFKRKMQPVRSLNLCSLVLQ